MKKLAKILAAIDDLDADARWVVKQHLAGDQRYYGDGGTLHGTTVLDVETFDGMVASVWFRCQILPFKQHPVTARRAVEIARSSDTVNATGRLTGVEIGPG